MNYRRLSPSQEAAPRRKKLESLTQKILDLVALDQNPSFGTIEVQGYVHVEQGKVLCTNQHVYVEHQRMPMTYNTYVRCDMIQQRLECKAAATYVSIILRWGINL